MAAFLPLKVARSKTAAARAPTGPRRLVGVGALGPLRSPGDQAGNPQQRYALGELQPIAQCKEGHRKAPGIPPGGNLDFPGGPRFKTALVPGPPADVGARAPCGFSRLGVGLRSVRMLPGDYRLGLLVADRPLAPPDPLPGLGR